MQLNHCQIAVLIWLWEYSLLWCYKCWYWGGADYLLSFYHYLSPSTFQYYITVKSHNLAKSMDNHIAFSKTWACFTAFVSFFLSVFSNLCSFELWISVGLGMVKISVSICLLSEELYNILGGKVALKKE